MSRKLLLAGAAAVGLLATPQIANAATYAISTLEISKFILTGAPAFSSFQFTQVTSASLAPGGNAAGGSDTSSAAAGTLDPAQAFIGSVAAPGPNDFTAKGNTPTYARADGIVTDTRINATTGTPGGGGALKQIAETSVAGAVSSQAQSGVTKQDWNFTFTATSNSIAHVSFDAALHLLVDMTDTKSVSATAFSNVTVRLKDQTTQLEEVETFNTGLTPLTASKGGSRFAPVDDLGPRTFDVSGTFTRDFTLHAGDTYVFEVTTQSNVDAAAVPEPTTLSLLGLGLLGLGYRFRRRIA